MIERTFDTELVRSIIGDKELFRRTGDESINWYDPENQDDNYYLSVIRDNDVIGIILFHVTISPFCYQGHVNYLPKYWGSGLAEYTKEAIQWMFDNTNCIKVVAYAPDYYPEVLKHAIKSGLKIQGYLTNSTMIDGKLDSQTILGVEKWEQQQ